MPSGAPIPAALLYFYVTGSGSDHISSTPATTYSDAALTTPNTNPVVADATGTFPNIFLDPSVNYSAQQCYPPQGVANPVVIWTASPLTSAITAGSLGFSQTTTYSAGSVGIKLQQTISPTDPPWNVSGSGTTADMTNWNNALAYCMANGCVLNVPPGTYKITSSIVMRPTTALSYDSAFVIGPKIIGAGVGCTIFDNQISNGNMFDLDSNVNHATTFQGVFQPRFEGFSVIRTQSTTAGNAFQLRTCYNATLCDIHIFNQSGSGVVIPTTVGDNDGSNIVNFERVRVENCAVWGINIGSPGHNETSFVTLDGCAIQGCGTDMGSISQAPTSGGMNWVGQICDITESYFTINKNVPLYVPGQAGLAQGLSLNNVDFENNIRRAGPLISGIVTLRANIQMYSNDTHVATVGFECDGSSYLVQDVVIDTAYVRASVGNNAYTAFLASGQSFILNSCRVKHVNWNNFDYAGQTRFNGWQFDQVHQDCVLEISATNLLTFHPNPYVPTGNKTPLRLRGGQGGTPSTTGEWVAAYVRSGGWYANNSGLTANTRYYVYVYDNNGQITLNLDTVGWVADSSSGYAVKSTDATMLYIGSVVTDGSSNFLVSGSAWANPTPITGLQVGIPYYIFPSSSTQFQYCSTFPTSSASGTTK